MTTTASLDRDTYTTEGFIGPVTILAPQQASLVARHFDDKPLPKPLRWHKGIAATDRLVYEIATLPVLLARVVDLLGPDVVLWGASVVDRQPGESHPWHTDIETCAPDARCVTAWIGLDNTTSESSLQVIPGSHRYGLPLQQEAQAQGIAREARAAAQALQLARRHAPDARIEMVSLTDGEAVLFDGRLWHGSRNSLATGRRRALLLQYAAAGTPIRMPDWSQLDPPFRFQAVAPPVLVVAGSAAGSSHDCVPPPPRSPEALPALYPLVRQLPAPLLDDPKRGWRPHFMFRGTTPVLNQLGCHVSVLNPGRSPHLPHSHLEEEILVVLDGQAQIVIATAPDDPAPRTETFGPGDWIYYPAYQHHTLRGIGERPVTYLMFRWHNLPLADDDGRLGLRLERANAYVAPSLKPRAIKTTLAFEGPTAHCTTLHAHRTRVTAGGGYEPHDDAHDVAIVLLRGKVKTLGRTVRAPAVIFYPADLDHGLRGVGDEPADYLVFEFHREPRTWRGAPDTIDAGDRLQNEFTYRWQTFRAGVERIKRSLAG